MTLKAVLLIIVGFATGCVFTAAVLFATDIARGSALKAREVEYKHKATCRKMADADPGPGVIMRQGYSSHENTCYFLRATSDGSHMRYIVEDVESGSFPFACSVGEPDHPQCEHDASNKFDELVASK